MVIYANFTVDIIVTYLSVEKLNFHIDLTNKQIHIRKIKNNKIHQFCSSLM